MSMRNSRRISWALGLALMSGLAVYPLATRTARAEEHEHNPRIHRALDALREARQELHDAPHDFRGHKQEALDSIDRAIEHLDRIKDW
jgi:hypothetical protein